MGHLRPRYNVKGRAASIAAALDGSHGKRKREYVLGEDDSNAAIIDEVARKKRREEVRIFFLRWHPRGGSLICGFDNRRPRTRLPKWQESPR